MEPKNDPLWELAKKRACFKKNLISYCIVNLFFWGVWFVSNKPNDPEDYFPWPVWIMLAWGIGLAMNYANAYMFHSQNDIEQEYKKLKNQQ